MKSDIRFRITENAYSVVAEGDYFEVFHFLDEEEKERNKCLNQFAFLSKDEIQKKLEKNEEEKIEKRKMLETSMNEYIQSTIRCRLLEKELEIIQRAENLKEYFCKEEKNFNKVICKDNEIDVSITNGIYQLHIFAEKYLVNYRIHTYLSINEKLLKEDQYYTTIESFHNNSYKELEKVHKYIENKLKKYHYLFSIKKAILSEHIKEFHIPQRIIQETGIQVFSSKEELLQHLKKIA